uniref:Peptidase A1 domain-containing protein n=1 Tax=Timema tahoe TaxID=61484 RepID=A0A7R9FKF6_9NEOP|nr:unnamed protein product [Timema tahoe]
MSSRVDNPQPPDEFHSWQSYQNTHLTITCDPHVMSSCVQSEFYGKISIGRPAQTFSVVFDTAWSNSWLAHLKIKNQTFAEIVSVPLLYLFSKADGVLGMAYSSFSVDGVLPFFYNLVKQNLVAQPIFSFYINNDRTTDRAGNLFLGGADPKHYNGSMTFVPVTEKAYWQFKMSGLQGRMATLFTAYNKVEALKEKIILWRDMVNCATVNKLPEISFLIGGKNFTLKARNYIQQISWGGFELCLSAFVATDLAAPYDNLWALGAAFIGQYYTEFDLGKNRIGFAESYQ